MPLLILFSWFSIIIGFLSTTKLDTTQQADSTPKFKLIPAPKITFNSFVDCNMAEVWIGDTFRIFPGKYGEDPLWGYAKDLKYSDGENAEAVFKNPANKFFNPSMPSNAPVGQKGLHGAVWFETVYQDSKDKSGQTLFGIYHNENYPSTLPYDSVTKEGYRNVRWPQGLTGPESPAAVCRIGVMKSIDGGKSWDNRGIFIEDYDPRMIRKPFNTSNTFAGGVGDPSAGAPAVRVHRRPAEGRPAGAALCELVALRRLSDAGGRLCAQGLGRSPRGGHPGGAEGEGEAGGGARPGRQRCGWQASRVHGSGP